MTDDQLIEYLNSIGAIAQQPKWSRKILFYRSGWKTYFKLKNLRRWYWQTVYDLAERKRLSRKSNHNKELPDACPVFFPPQRSPSEYGRVASLRIPELFDEVRRSSPKLVNKLTTVELERIDRLYYAVLDWFQRNRLEPDPFVARQSRLDYKAGRWLSVGDLIDELRVEAGI